MAVYLISYDLVAPGRDYDDLYNKIKSLGPWWHQLESTWIISTDNYTVSSIRDELASVVDSNDKILVVELKGSWATWKINKSENDWLRDVL